jgi:pimeloyl-ACP methyl ester carboxylesterase
VLLGGAAEPSWVWHRTGRLLARAGHRVFALDLPPFGYTQRRGPYTLAGWSALVRGFDRRLGLRRPLVVGHSLGAGVAVALALRDPRSVGGIVLLDGDALPVGHGLGWAASLLVWPWYPALYDLLTSQDFLIRRVLQNAWGSTRPKLTHSIVAVFERPFRVRGSVGAFQELLRGGVPGVSIAQLRQVRVPRAVVWGAHDDVDSIGAGRRTAAALGVPLRVVPGAAHLSMLGNPEGVAKEILRSLRTFPR